MGWIAGSRGVDAFRRGAEGVQQAWVKGGRDGKPWLLALPYFSLGPEARRNAEAFLGDHYAIEGQGIASRVVSYARTDPDAIRDSIAAYRQAGCNELILFPCSPDPRQVRLLAGVIR